MSKIFEEYGDERAAEAREEARNKFVQNLLRDGSMPIERIASVAEVPLEQVQHLAQRLTASVRL